MLRQLKGLVQAVAARVGGRFSKRRHIFELVAPDFPPVDMRYTVRCYTNLAEIPPALVTAVRQENELLFTQMQQRFPEKARLYVLTAADGKLGCLMWVKSGSDVKRWMVPLDPADRVIYGAYTPIKMRGRRLWPHTMRAAIAMEGVTGGRVLSDCDVFNQPSRNALLRQGFRIIATARIPGR